MSGHCSKCGETGGCDCSTASSDLVTRATYPGDALNRLLVSELRSLTAAQAARNLALEAREAELVEALAFYQNGFEPFKEHKHLPGFAWRPKETLLDDCGEMARAALAKAKDAHDDEG